MTKVANPGSAQNKRYHHGDLHDALIIAAAELIEESGSDDFAMIDAARKAGVSSAAPYRHFSDRDALLDAVSRLGYYALSSQLLETQANYQAGSAECIIALGKRYIHFVTSHPAFFDLMWGERGSKVQQILEQEQPELKINGFWLLVNQVRAWCDQEGLIDAEPEDLALKLWSMSIGLSHIAIHYRLERFVVDVDIEEILSTSTTSFLSGVKQTDSSQRKVK